MFTSGTFIVSGLIFEPLIHFELIFVYGIREESEGSLFYMWLTSFPNTFTKGTNYSFQTEYSWHLC